MCGADHALVHELGAVFDPSRIRGEFSEQERLTAEAAALAEQAGDRDAHVNLPHLNLAAASPASTASTTPSTRPTSGWGCSSCSCSRTSAAPYPRSGPARGTTPWRVRDRRRACRGDRRGLAGRRPRRASGHPRPPRRARAARRWPMRWERWPTATPGWGRWRRWRSAAGRCPEAA